MSAMGWNNDCLHSAHGLSELERGRGRNFIAYFNSSFPVLESRTVLS